jgi:ankyrin repeat protein
MGNEEFRLLLEHGDAEGVRSALALEPELAHRTIHWHLNQDNQSDPLHYISDCIGNGWLTNGSEGKLTELLLAYGAEINGTDGRESPLIAAASLGADKVAQVLIEAGADMELTSIYGSRALHWAAWTGASATVALLIRQGAEIEVKDARFGATPLFWAVHGYGPNGPKQKRDQVGAARILIDAGAEPQTANKDGVPAIELARSCVKKDMCELLQQHV